MNLDNNRSRITPIKSTEKSFGGSFDKNPKDKVFGKLKQPPITGKLFGEIFDDAVRKQQEEATVITKPTSTDSVGMDPGTMNYLTNLSMSGSVVETLGQESKINAYKKQS